MANDIEIIVNFKSSKDSSTNIGIIPIITLIISVLTLLVSWRVNVHTEKVEETKQLNNYLDKLNEIIIGEEEEKKTELIDDRPSFAFKLEQIKEIDYLTRAYTRNLNSDSRRVVLIYLYESDLINHTKATGHESIGQEGICKTYKDKVQQGNILIESEKANLDTYPYCNLSTNRYYFNNIDMSGVFLKHIKLHNSYLNRANFTRSKLRGANFSKSGLRGTNFTNAELMKANFTDADLERFEGEGCIKILRVKLSLGVIFPWIKLNICPVTNFTDADLRGVNLTNANLSQFIDEKKGCDNPKDCQVANLTYANLTGAKLMKANLTNADLTNANLQDTVFGGTNLYCTNLTDAKNINIDEIKQQPSFWSATYNKDMEAKLNLSDTQKENRESICKK
ncbi:pentapeptide repeat-containing protein [Crocosphaera sp. Alani8]|uniref:pentapeptide repeat-containing protein n=1 Tax=Crocosphaera sp. Alani8 TaxID=3038952 RepID=UPI00313AE1BC